MRLCDRCAGAEACEHAKGEGESVWCPGYEPTDATEKPPLGCKPAWLAYKQRIDDLSQAICRYAGYARSGEHFALMAAWAREIEELCDLIRDIDYAHEAILMRERLNHDR